jgi:hypothetical protein
LAVVGWFDPLTVTQAKRVAELSARGRPILGVVEAGEDSLVPVEARAIMLAALRSVQLVVIADAAALRAYPQLEIVADEAAERKRSAEFVEFVKRRQGA